MSMKHPHIPFSEFRALASSGNAAAARTVTKRFAKKRAAPGEAARGANLGRCEEDQMGEAERRKRRNKRGKPVSGAKARRKQAGAPARARR